MDTSTSTSVPGSADSSQSSAATAENTGDNVPQLAAWVMRMREGLHFFRRPGQHPGDPTEFIIEDATRDKFYRVGEREYAVLTRIDGTSSLESIIQQLRQTVSEFAMTEEQALEIGRWLLSTGLGHLISHPIHGEFERAQAIQLRRQLGWLNPISLKFKLGNPDHFLDLVLPLCRWMLGPLGAAIGLLVAIYGGLVVITEWDRFSADMRGILGPDRWWLLLAVWLGLKGFHELAHGLTCKKYGGHVREWGVLLILFAPLGAWVNVTSSWKFPSRWQRIHVAAAGMISEIVLAGFAAIAWSHCQPGLLRYALQNVVISASVVTILFNINSLMRFDGYFILSEWLGIPNLAGRGQQAVSRQWQRVLLGIRTPALSSPHSQRMIVSLYGWSALYWRILTGVGILIACSTLFHGFGLVLTISCAALSYAWPLLRTLKSIASSARTRTVSLWRMSAGVMATGGLLLALFTVIPWPGNFVGHGVVDYASRTTIRAEASGFIRRVQVNAGDHVNAGQLLFVLENPELVAEATINQSMLAEARDRASYFLAEKETAAWRSEEERIASLSSRTENTQRRLKGLNITAPQNGRILAHDLHDLEGQWVERGTLLCEIGQDDVKEVVFAISQYDLETLSHDHLIATGKLNVTSGHHPARIISAGDHPQMWSVTLQDFLPTAEWIPPHAALSGHVGGPLPVHMITEGGSSNSRWQLLTPHLAGHVELTPEQSLTMRSGERVTIQLTEGRTPFAMHLLRVASEWLENRMKAAWRMTTSGNTPFGVNGYAAFET